MTTAPDAAGQVDEGQSWIIVLDGHPPSPNRIRGSHWAQRWRPGAEWRDAIAWHARALGFPAPLEHAVVVARFIYHKPPLRDTDNAIASLKGALDGLVLGGLVLDDSPAHLQLLVEQVLGEATQLVLVISRQGDTGDSGHP